MKYRVVLMDDGWYQFQFRGSFLGGWLDSCTPGSRDKEIALKELERLNNQKPYRKPKIVEVFTQ